MLLFQNWFGVGNNATSQQTAEVILSKEDKTGEKPLIHIFHVKLIRSV